MICTCTAQVETQLNKTKDARKAKSIESQSTGGDGGSINRQSYPGYQSGLAADIPSRPAVGGAQRQQSISESNEYSSMPDVEDHLMVPMTGDVVPDMNSDPQMMGDLNLGLDPNFSWEMIGLGLEEPMPLPEAVEELYVIQLLN